MKGRLDTEIPAPFPGFMPLEKETILFCAQTDKRVKNPLDNNREHPETVVVTDQRLLALSMVSPSARMTAVSIVPLERVSAVQCTYLGWDAWKILACIILFLLYIIPGVIFLVWMNRNLGPRVHLVSGVFAIDLRFHREHPALFNKFMASVQRRS